MYIGLFINSILVKQVNYQNNPFNTHFSYCISFEQISVTNSCYKILFQVKMRNVYWNFEQFCGYQILSFHCNDRRSSFCHVCHCICNYDLLTINYWGLTHNVIKRLWNLSIWIKKSYLVHYPIVSDNMNCPVTYMEYKSPKNQSNSGVMLILIKLKF